MDSFTDTLPAPAVAPVQQRRLLMCPPMHFGVAYVINPWMHPEKPVDRALALRQWQGLAAAYRAHGHAVDTIDAEPGLPDMVYAANSALVLDGTAWLARFRHSQRRGEEPAYERWFEAHGFRVRRAQAVHEGEGDFALCGEHLLAGTGFRTSVEAHAEAAAVFDRPVVSLRLVDPRFYHLDMALAALDGERIMYYPGAFDADSRFRLCQLYPDAVIAGEDDALAFGLNAMSDGCHVFIAAEAEALAGKVADAGFTPVPVELSELRRGGGGIKCCTLELR